MEPISTAVLTASIKTTFDLIEKGLNEKATASVLRDHLALVKDRLSFVSDQAAIIVDQIRQLEQEKAALEEGAAHLDAELKTYREAEQFVEHRGAFFQRKPEGGYRLQVFCPTCRGIASSPVRGVAYRCVNCHWSASFEPRQLSAIMAELR